MVSHLLLSYGIRDLCSIPKEVKISANSALSSVVASEISPEGVVIEVIVGFLKLVAESIVSVLEVDASR